MKLNVKRTVFVGLAFMSITAFWQVYDTVIPLMLKDSFDVNDGLIGVVMGVDNILALIMLPLFGRFSDKTITKIGRRMPYILLGTAGALLFLFLMPFAESINNLPLFFIGLGFVLIFMATYRSPAVALMPDVTPKPLRSQGNAIINLLGAVGGMLMLVALSIFPVTGEEPNYLIIFVILSIVMVLCVCVLFWKIKENFCAEQMKLLSKASGIPVDDEDEENPTVEKMPSDVKRSFIFILTSIFLWFFGYNAITSAFSRYAGQELQGNFALVLLLCTAAAIIAYIPVGIIAAKIGRRKTILIGIVMLAIAFFAGSFFNSVNVYLYIFFAFAGFGWAFINVNSYPMVVELSQGSDVGKYTGYYYTVSMSSQILTPAISGFLMDSIGYRILFPYGTIFVALSFITMLFVKHGDSKPAPKKGITALDVEQ